ncbi:protein kinase domain-containing protein [Pyxidicoccus sp. 3LFB2]
MSLYGDELEPGALVGLWVVEARVHSGVTAWLYRASHISTRVPAAVKVVRAELNHVSEVLRRFKQEADTLQALRHPNIVEVLEYGELRDGRPWLAMEWLPGESVDQWLAHRGPFSAAEALTVMEELGGALHLAHRQGVLHRDLKAQNVMVIPRAEGFTVKLVDFGIARVQAPEGLTGLTSAGAVLGTPVAMAPEQIRGQAVDARTDLYSLGVLLYQLLTGRLPFEGTSAVEVEEQHLHAPPPRLGERVHAPPALEAVVQRCLAKRPEERWPDVPAFLEALRAALAPATSPPWAVGIYVDARFPESHEEPTDEDFDAKEAALDTPGARWKRRAGGSRSTAATSCSPGMRSPRGMRPGPAPSTRCARSRRASSPRPARQRAAGSMSASTSTARRAKSPRTRRDGPGSPGASCCASTSGPREAPPTR